MTWWQAAILGLVQGVAEFLPISSSGHLVLGQELLDIDKAVLKGVTFEVFTHFGTVLSILTVYRERFWNITKQVFTFSNYGERFRENQDFRFALFILITIVPTGIAYLIFRDQITSAFDSPRLACWMLLVTGTLLLLTLLRPNADGPLTTVKSFFIGCAQSLALLPGISRSGSTICTSLYMNVKNRTAADFSFLMSVPVILGATLIDAVDMISGGLEVDLVPILIGTVVAYFAGLVAIRTMIDLVSRGNLHYFAFYVFIVGAVGLLFVF
jgi:undecaprenyl-diphosphatase